MKNFSIRSLLAFTAIVAVLCSLLFNAIAAARKATLQMQCSNNLKQLGLALLNYESATSSLPLAIETTQDGDLWRSWRSRVYPTFMVQMPPIYDSSTAWDSKSNQRRLNGTPIPFSSKGGRVTKMVSHDRIPDSFHCPACRNAIGVNYVLVTGEGTAFPKSRAVKLSDITDGLENTIIVVESVTCTPDWIEPYDLEIESMALRINAVDNPSISSCHSVGAQACFADGKVFTLTPRLTALELKALLTIAGAEPVTRRELVERGVLLPNAK